MKVMMFGDGAKGMAFQRALDVSGLGVILEARREDRHSPFVQTWRYRWLPNRAFSSYAELLRIVNGLDDAAIERERAAWPKATEFVSETTNPCWLDGQPGAVFITVQTSWCEYGGAPLCATCGELAKADPGVVVRAGEKRAADVAARKPLAIGGIQP